MELVVEADDDIALLAHTKSGIWLPVFRWKLQKKDFDLYHFPLLLKVQTLGQIDQSIDSLPSGDPSATAQSF